MPPPSLPSDGERVRVARPVWKTVRARKGVAFESPAILFYEFWKVSVCGTDGLFAKQCAPGRELGSIPMLSCVGSMPL